VSSRPSLTTIADRIRNDLISRISTDDVLRRSDAEIQARVLSFAMHALYGYADYIADQMFPETCDESNLERHAGFWKVTRNLAAKATGSVTFDTSIGAVIPIDTVISALDGTQYKTTVEATAVSGSTVVAVEAVVAAQAGNRVTGQSLTLLQPVSGVQTTCTCGDLTGGADIETISAWRARVVAAVRKPPAAGTKEDYERWALEVSGVTRAWAYPLEMGLGSTVIRFVRDDDVSIIPDAGEIADVQDYIDTLRPVGPGISGIQVVAPVAEAVAFTIHISPDNADVRAAVTAELDDLFLRAAVPGTTDYPNTIYLSQIREAVSLAAGETDSAVTVPAADVTKTGGKLATRGTITWV
jgi:uncharacterized phage protein gp47/JayE